MYVRCIFVLCIYVNRKISCMSKHWLWTNMNAKLCLHGSTLQPSKGCSCYTLNIIFMRALYKTNVTLFSQCIIYYKQSRKEA